MTVRQRLQNLWITFGGGSTISRYATAIVAALLADLGRWLMNPFWGEGFPYVFAYPTTLFVSLLCGLGPGLTVVVITGAGIWHHVLSGSTTANLMGQLFFFLSNSATAWIASEHRRASRQLIQRDVVLAARLADLGEAYARLSATNRELESFSYSLSHVLRAPLRAIDGFSQRLLADHTGQLDDEGKRLLGVVHENVSEASQMIDDILAVSDVARHTMALKEIPMEALVRSLMEPCRPPMNSRRLEPGCVDLGRARLVIKPMPNAIGDRALVQRLWGLLLANAIKFSSPRTDPVVEAGGETLNGDNVYYVKDNGVGFDMSHAGKLFDVFQRLHHSDQFPGLGMGLAVAGRIVARHGGRIWAEAKVDEGATFFFTLPGPRHKLAPTPGAPLS